MPNIMNRDEFVCYCYSVTQIEVQAAIAAGARTLEALRSKLRVSGCCGSCEPRVRACLRAAEVEVTAAQRKLASCGLDFLTKTLNF